MKKVRKVLLGDRHNCIADLVERNNIKKVLREIFLFKSMKDQQVDEVVMRLEKKKYGANEYVFKQGDPSDSFYLIIKGTIAVTKVFEKDGPEKTLRNLAVNDYLGERGYYNNIELRVYIY